MNAELHPVLADWGKEAPRVGSHRGGVYHLWGMVPGQAIHTAKHPSSLGLDSRGLGPGVTVRAIPRPHDDTITDCTLVKCQMTRRLSQCNYCSAITHYQSTLFFENLPPQK